MARRALMKVLYVEDDPDIQEITRMALEAVGGFLVRTCNNGVEAIDAAQTFEPNVILLDVLMPEMDGLATLQALRHLPTTRNATVIFMTAKVRPEEVRQYHALGAEFIAKPYDPMRLAEQVRHLWAKHRESGEDLMAT